MPIASCHNINCGVKYKVMDGNKVAFLVPHLLKFGFVRNLNQSFFGEADWLSNAKKKSGLTMLDYMIVEKCNG